MWGAVGFAFAAFTAAFAISRWRHESGNYYARDVYGLTRSGHRNYAIASLLFSGFFLAALFVRALPAVVAFGAFTLLAIFYFSSFARGFSDED